MKKAIALFVLISSFALSFGQAYKVDQLSQDSSLYESPNKVIKGIQLVGNKVTKDHIILREISFKVGDTLENEAFFAQIEQSRKNLLNTSLFNFVRVDLAVGKPNEAYLVIHLQERWYTFPLPIFEIDDNNFNTWWEDKDFSRLNYGFTLIRHNFRGRKEKLSATAQFGFTERLKLDYDIPYINRNQKAGLNIDFSYNRRDQITYTSFDNQRLQYKSNEDDAVRNYSAGLTYQYRAKIFNTHRLGLEYDFNEIKDTVRDLNPNYLGNNESENHFFSIYYSFTHDRRDSKNYPLSGNYFSASVRKYGLGILESPIDLTNLQLQIKKFWPLGKGFYFANSFRGIATTNNNQPYLLQNGLGYSQSFTLRSYEYYVIDGQNIGLAKAQLRYQLVKPNHAQLNLLPWERFNRFHYAMYLGIFSDAGYVDDNTGFPANNLANELQFGYGLGLDFVTYYDMVIRTEFSFNKFGESGLFLHFVAPI
jgi:outer membrane protein assembly factor BamA